MTTLDDWPRVKRVLAGALAYEGAERQLYLADACGSDAELRARVDRLLAAGEGAAAFLETSAMVLIGPGPRDDLSGRVVDSYRVQSRLGAGGMGEVYLAHDSKLDRPVALKFLSPELSRDRDRLRRFHREARAASSLNHPNIVVVHDFGEMDGRPYMVTELIEGETLRQRLRRGPLAMRDVVELGVQVAGALAAAHARGLVHRDVKPENIMLRPDGYAKVLDFGLAKLGSGTRSREVEAHTQPGMVLGTPRYMSPEQARGLDLDARSDVWSLGVVLYEMATGALPFGEDGAVLAFEAGRDAPLPDPGLPPELLRITCKALHTVRELRYQDGTELGADLRRLQDTAFASSGQSGTRSLRRGGWAGSLGPARLVLAALLAITVGLVSVWMMRRPHAKTPAGVQKTLAVLPFDNVGGDADIEYLRVALADEIATALSASSSLAVRPMASSRRFADGRVSPVQAGRELRAGAVVIGHFSRQQSKLHVTVEAVEVDGDRVVWRETIAADTSDSIARRDRLTARIRDGLLPALGVTAAAVSAGRPRNADAYALYLKSLAHSWDPAPNREAIAMLERASAMEPDHAETWNALGQRYYDDGHYGGGGSEALRRAEAALRQARALDPGHAAASVRLTNLQVEAGRLQDAYDSAIQLVARHPHSGEAHFGLSYVLRYGGLLEESAQECEEAVSRDPTNPRFRTCVSPLMALGRYERALDFVRLDQGSELSRALTRVVYQRMGRRHDAREQHRLQSPAYLREVAPEGYHGFMTRCLEGPAPGGRERLSDDDVRTFLTLRNDPEPLFLWASDVAYCGDSAAAIQLLRESIRRNYCAVAIETDPSFASVRQDTEYAGLLRDAHACRDRFSEHVRRSGRDG